MGGDRNALVFLYTFNEAKVKFDLLFNSTWIWLDGD